MNWLELKIPPPLVMLIIALLMWLASLLAGTVSLPFVLRVGVALALVLTGLSITIAGARTLRRAGTTMNPIKPESASSLAGEGIYRYTRNPMYVGLAFLLLAWAVYLASAPALVLLPVFVLYMNRCQIGPEERALAALFGSEYTAYRARVRRWL